MRKSILLLFLVTVVYGGLALASQEAPQLRWFKGNTHAHTIESDGDSPPEVVARWYAIMATTF